MPCYHPITMYRCKALNPSGKFGYTFNPKDGLIDKQKLFPCGKCIGCRMELALQNTIRCEHEAQYYLEKGRESMFLTLTYDDSDKSKLWSLNKEDFQKFAKRYRKNYDSEFVDGLRYFMCGEYGENLERPHYHAIIFGHVFDDLEEFTNDKGHKMYHSEKLSKLWPYGESVIGTVTFESMNYVCSHVIKIMTNNKKTGVMHADNHYCGRLPEFSLRSLKPGLGYRWYKKYGHQLYNNDELVIRDGFIHKPPRYYDKKLEEETMVMKSVDNKSHFVYKSEKMEQIKHRREVNAVQRAVSEDRRYAKEAYKKRLLYNRKIRRKKKNV